MYNVKRIHSTTQLSSAQLNLTYRWIPLQSKQKTFPKLTLAHWGFFWPQSQHWLFPGIAFTTAWSAGVICDMTNEWYYNIYSIYSVFGMDGDGCTVWNLWLTRLDSMIRFDDSTRLATQHNQRSGTRMETRLEESLVQQYRDLSIKGEATMSTFVCIDWTTVSP